MSNIIKKSNLLHNLFIYSECNLIYFTSSLGAFKTKIFPFIRVTMSSNYFNFIKLFFFRLRKTSYKIYYSRVLGLMLRMISQGLRGIRSGFIVRFVLIGVGFKIYNKKNFTYFKLGYSHLVKLFNPLQLRIIKKKRKGRFSIISTSYENIKNYSADLIQLKKPGTYTGKGLRVRKSIFVKKSWKKSSY